MDQNFCTHDLHVSPSQDLTSLGCFYFRRVYLVIRSKYAYRYIFLKQEKRIVNESRCCTHFDHSASYTADFDFKRRQISSDTTSSPLFATAAKEMTF